MVLNHSIFVYNHKNPIFKSYSSNNEASYILSMISYMFDCWIILILGSNGGLVLNCLMNGFGIFLDGMSGFSDGLNLSLCIRLFLNFGYDYYFIIKNFYEVFANYLLSIVWNGLSVHSLMCSNQKAQNSHPLFCFWQYHIQLHPGGKNRMISSC